MVAEANFIANGATEVEAYLAIEGGNHGTCFNPAISTTIEWFDSKRTACEDLTVATSSLDDREAINIHPNPTSGLANIKIKNQWTGELELRIVNALGQVVHTATFEKYAEEAVVAFDAGQLPKGLYQVLASDGQVMAVGSFIRL